MLEAEVGGSAALVWSAKEFLRVAPTNPEEIARLLAAAAMMAGAEDDRDLLVWLVKILDAAEQPGIASDAGRSGRIAGGDTGSRGASTSS